MSKTTTWGTAAIFLVTVAHAETPPGERAESLFDGATLTGWSVVPGGRSSDWRVEDGAIVGESSGRESYLVWNETDLSDFELRLSYRLRTDGNTGVQIRSYRIDGGSHWLKGYQADLGHVGIGPKVLGAWDFHGEDRGDILVARGKRVAIDSAGRRTETVLPKSLEVSDVARRDWNQARIVCRGSVLRFFINGTIASEVLDEEVNRRVLSGLVALQLSADDGMRVEFKDLRVKRLAARGAAVVAEPWSLPLTLSPAGEVIAFAGGTNTVRALASGYLEALLQRRFQGRRPRIRDLSWDGDTVYQQSTVAVRWRRGAFGDWPAQLRRVGATMVFAQFGQLESLAGPRDLKRFVASYAKLLDQFAAVTSRIVLLSPTPFEKPSDPLVPDLSRRNDDLARYVRKMAELASTRGYPFIDLFTPLRATKARLTSNGVHVLPSAQERIARRISSALGMENPDGELDALRAHTVRKSALWTSYWRPANWKCLYGDDGERIFGRAAGDSVSFRDEWKTLPELIEAEERALHAAASDENENAKKVR